MIIIATWSLNIQVSKNKRRSGAFFFIIKRK